jgi:hypothetical protein
MDTSIRFSASDFCLEMATGDCGSGGERKLKPDYLFHKLPP